LQDYLTGRFNLVSGIIFSRITWAKDDDYSLNAINHLDFRKEALSCAQVAWDHLKRSNLPSDPDRRMDALNNLLLYSALDKGAAGNRRASASLEEATKILNLAADFKADVAYKNKPLFVNTYCFVILAFHRYLADGSEAAILDNLEELEQMLKINLDSKAANPSNRHESSRLLKMLSQFRAEMETEDFSI
jgi:hypothetical protein